LEKTSSVVQPPVTPRRTYLLVLLAITWVALNATKPLQVDDTAYFHYARQLAAHPLDPYGFAIYWYDVPQSANEVLAPPVFPATWAIALRLGPDQPWAWKLLLAPWAVLLVLSLEALLRRFASGMEMPLLLLVVASPALLPALNLMLDIPALALGLAAVALFLRSCDRDSLGLAIGAGLVAGLAMQTKYTAFLVPAVQLLAAGLWRRWRLGVAAAAAAGQVFLTWEFLMAILYGESHFLLASRSTSATLLEKARLAPALAGHAGGLLPGVLLFALLALGARRRGLRLVAAGAVLAFGLVALRGWLPGYDPKAIPILECAVFGLLGLTLFAVLPALFVHLLRSDATSIDRRDTLFLLAWLGLEVLGYFALTPFPAARRILGITVVLILLVGRLAARRCSRVSDLPSAVAIVAGSTMLGILFAVVDHLEARAQQAAVARASAWITEHCGGRVWYVGHWGYQFHAERAGMEPLIAAVPHASSPIPLPAASAPRPGDWIVVPDSARVHVPAIDLDHAPLDPVVVVHSTDPVPLRTLWPFYSGYFPLEAHSGPRLEVTVYRVRAGFVPRLGSE
jgi:hypothetical protein